MPNSRSLLPGAVRGGPRGKNTKVRKPASLCLPVDAGGGVVDRADRLVCYEIKSAPGQPRFDQRDISVVSPIANQTLTARKPSTLCVPSTVVLE